MWHRIPLYNQLKISNEQNDGYKHAHELKSVSGGKKKHKGIFEREKIRRDTTFTTIVIEDGFRCDAKMMMAMQKYKTMAMTIIIIAKKRTQHNKHEKIVQSYAYLYYSEAIDSPFTFNIIPCLPISSG